MGLDERISFGFIVEILSWIMDHIVDIEMKEIVVKPELSKVARAYRDARYTTV